MFDIKNPNSFLGGQNVHNLIIIGLLIYIIFKLMKKSKEESSMINLTGEKRERVNPRETAGEDESIAHLLYHFH